MVEA
jgi:hypothetical protein